MIRSRSFWAQMSGWGHQLKYSRRAVRTFRESGRYNKPITEPRWRGGRWPRWHDGSYTGFSCLFRRMSSPDTSKASGTPATRQGGELQRQRRDGQDHDRGSKSELAGASASSRSPPLTEAKAGRNCSAQDRPVAQPSFTRGQALGPFPGEPGSRPDRHISDSPSV